MAGPASSIPFGHIPGYEVQGKLGAGGMGVVYKALDLKLHRTVALKFLAQDEVAEEDRDILLREARAASALDHPNIAAVYTVEETSEGHTCLVMGYYEGETLFDKIRHGPIQPARAVNFAMQIARGLQHAHARNIIHRDIKPSNVIITDDGTAKILDFGLARKHGASASTGSASMRGTLLYISPEQARGKTADPRSDIWALSVVLYQMLTGRLPFHTDSAASTILEILSSPPAPMTGVAEDLQLIILRGLSKEPAARYQNCAEMLRALEQVAVDDAQPTLTINRAELKRELRSATQSATGTLIAPGPRKMWLVIAICLAIGLGIALAAMLMMNGQMFGPREKHIAVLPFETNSQDPADQNVADGLMERITSQLSNLDAGKNSLWIVPSSEIRRLKIEDAKAASRELGATVAVAGRLQRTGKAITLLVDVIDAKSMRLLGSASLEQSLSGSTSVDQDAVQRIASILRVDMRSNFDEGNVLATQYENYLQGRALLQRFDKPGNRDEAIRLFQSVVSADPQFALGYASLGEAYWGKYRFDRNPEWLKRGAEYCNRAIQLNKKLPAVYTTLARIHDDSGNRDLALEEFDQALALDPRNADAHLGRASVYEAMGRYDDAENELKTAIDLRPEYWLGITELGSFYFRRNRVDDAMSAYRRVLDLVPDSASAHNNYGAVLSNNGRAKEAEAELRKSLQITENNYPAYANLGILYYRQKNWPEAARMTEKALQLNSSDYRVWGNLGISYEQMNDNEKAAAAYREELTRVEELAKFKSDDPFIQRELAVLYSKKKMRDEALRYLNAALARTPSDPRALTDAAEVYENLGDRTRALSFVQKAIAGGRTMDKLAENPGLRNVLSDPRLRKQ